jgi:hypothetical protein
MVSAVAVMLALMLTSSASSQQKIAPLNLSAAQKQIVWENIWRTGIGAIPIGFGASVGTIVPRAIKLQSLPQPVVEQVPALRSLAYAKSRNQILIVDSIRRTVVLVLER